MHKFKDVNNILVIKLRHIGDVLLTVPVFRALRETFPNARISALVNSGTEDILTDNPLIDEVLIFNRYIKNQNLISRYSKELSFLYLLNKKKFDMTVDLTSGDRAAIISLISGARYRIARDPGNDGFIGKKLIYTHRANIDRQRHMIFQNLDIVQQFGIKTDNTLTDFFVPDSAKQFAEKILVANGVRPTDTLVHIHPSSRWMFKCWKDEYVAEIIAWLMAQNIKVIITSSHSQKEMERNRKILSLLPNTLSLIDLTGKTTIKELAAITAVSTLFFGVDSAPMHIAVALSIPSVVLFGPTDETLWGPCNKKHIVIKEKLSCMPCKKGNCEGILLRECMEAIKPSVVINALSELLSNAKNASS